MNMKFWRKAERSFLELAVKLSEETGEVASEISDMHREVGRARETQLQRVIEECRHVEGIAQAIRYKAQEELVWMNAGTELSKIDS
jgi:hypothetical protein